MPESAKLAIGAASAGRRLSAEACEKIRQSKLGKPLPSMQHEKHPQWKGEDASYSALHQWLYRHKEKTGLCSRCGERPTGRTEWANVSGEYLRDLDDYVEMCVPCHKRADLDRRDALHDREMAAP